MFPRKLIKFYFMIFRKFPIVLIVSSLLAITAGFLDNTLWPFVNKWLVDIFESAAAGVLPNLFWYIIGLYVALTTLNALIKIIGGYWEPLISKYTNMRLYRHIYRNDTDFFVNTPTGQISSYVNRVASNFIPILITPITRIIGFTIALFVVVGTLLKMNPMLAIMVFSVTIIRGAWQVFLQRKINALKKVQVEMQSVVSGHRIDSLDNAITVKLFGTTDAENNYVWDKQMELLKLDRKMARLRIYQTSPTGMLWLVMQAMVILLSWHLIGMGQISVADGVFAFTGARTFGGEVMRIIGLLQSLSEHWAEATKAYSSIIVDQSITDAKNSHGFPSKKSVGIELDNVSFSYANGKNVIKNMTLSIASGERVGIVGLSGAGKTTLTNLMLRMYDVCAGAVRIGGRDVRGIKQDALRKHIAIVPQETSLFNRTILENIRYARPNATRAMVIAAAKRAHIHNFIMAQPNGYDTLVGNRGIKLSGGQKQRVAIARAILKDAPILILDEATSALDSESEMYIQSALQNVMRGKTTVAIAHRLSTLRNMDRIIVIHRGKIIEQGSHSRLLRSSKTYKKLWNLQTNGFVG